MPEDKINYCDHEDGCNLRATYYHEKSDKHYCNDHTVMKIVELMRSVIPKPDLVVKPKIKPLEDNSVMIRGNYKFQREISITATPVDIGYNFTVDQITLENGEITPPEEEK